MRRCPNISAATAAALALFALLTPASADSLPPSYTLTVDNSIPQIDAGATTFQKAFTDAQTYQEAVANAQAKNTTPDVSPPQIIAKIIPPGALQGGSSATASSANPLSFDQAGTTYDKNGIVVDLLSPVQSDGSQYIGFSFFGASFQPGQKILFSLTDPNLISNPPQFQPVDSNGNPLSTVHIALNPASVTGNSPGSMPSTTVTPHSLVPEPLSLVLWSALTGIGLWRTRRLRCRPVMTC
jgi:hypothetical protein